MIKDTKNKLTDIVSKLMHPYKGILAADESNSSANRRFKNFNIPQTEESRRKYRQTLFTTPNMEQYVSGVILYDETIRQMSDDGLLFRDILQDKDVLVGIKVDQGLVPFLSNSPEKNTQGLNGLNERLVEYKKMGATFTKWRSVFLIGKTMPSQALIKKNCEDLVAYARIVQKNEMVPILEPEILIEGSHDIEQSKHVMEKVFDILVAELHKSSDVYQGGIILKTSMVIAGKDAKAQSSHDMVARHTVYILRKKIPPQVGGVVFLSGGQSPDYALHNLDAIAKMGPHPWPVTFSFSRAIQQPALDVWGSSEGKDVEGTQKVFLERLSLNSLARQGRLEHHNGKINRNHVISLRIFFWITVLLFFIFVLILK